MKLLAPTGNKGVVMPVHVEERFASLAADRAHGDVGGGTFVAGVAFAGDRGISRVEVSVDDGATWADAELERPLSGLTWRRWRLALDPAGDPIVVVRATDGDGVLQPATYADPHPSGATGLDRVTL
jgi:hypothetical protein